MRTVTVQLQEDFLEHVAGVRKPSLAISELIWNALDADAIDVRVEFKKNSLGAIEEITVRDDGHAIQPDEVDAAFGNLGGSWKQTNRRSKKKDRILHGTAGKGRFTAFALGGVVQWTSYFKRDSRIEMFTITGRSIRKKIFEIEEPTLTCRTATGTDVTITEISRPLMGLTSDKMKEELADRFALYLMQYPDVLLNYDGIRINPAIMMECRTRHDLPPIQAQDGQEVSAQLEIIEWKTQKDRVLCLCDADGFVLETTTPGIHARGFSFTAYLKSELIRHLHDENRLSLQEMNPDLESLLFVAREKLRDYFRERSAESAASIVEEWKRDNIYPYEGPPSNFVEEAERQVFDVVALNVRDYLPSFDSSDDRSKKLSFRLLAQVISQSPAQIRRILEEVLDLPKEKLNEFAELIEKTSLTAVINASRLVTQRLDFIRGLETLVFEDGVREHVLERRHLHKIVEQHVWIFGEEFNLSVSDQSLDEVLRKHQRLLGRVEDVKGSVTSEDGRGGIVDLMLSRKIRQTDPAKLVHLVVELKRPGKKIDSEVAEQLEKYASAVAGDPRFRESSPKWVFWALSDEMDSLIQRRSSQRNRPRGLLLETDDDQNITIWVKTWGEIINDSKARLEFFRQGLDSYAPDRESGLQFLRSIHEKYLPSQLREQRAVAVLR